MSKFNQSPNIHLEKKKAASYLQQGDFLRAKKIYEKLAKINKHDVDIWSVLGYISGQLDDLRNAARYFYKAASLQPNDAQTQYNLGFALQKQKDWSKAIKAYAKAIYLNPEFVEAHYNLALCFHSANFLNEANETFAKLTALDPNNEKFLLGYASVLLELNINDKVITIANTILNNNKNSAQAHCLIGNALYNLERFSESESEFTKAVKIEPKTIEAYFGLGKINQLNGNLTKAIDYYSAANKCEPDNEKTLINLGNLFKLNARPEQAIPYYHSALGINPHSISALSGLADAEEMGGNWNNAINAYKRILKINRENDAACAGMAHILERQNKHEQALPMLQKLIAKAHPPITAVLSYAEIYRSSGDYEAAIKECERSLTNEANNPDNLRILHFKLGKLYDDVGNYKTAFSHYYKANSITQEKWKIVYDEIKQINYVDWCIEKFTPSSLNALPRSNIKSNIPVFVVGMPRSGTTLLEQIISSHPTAYGAGELPDVYNFVNSFDENFGNIKDTELSTGLESITQESIDDFSKRYVDKISSISNNKKRVVDKLPGNFLYLGIISMAFPDAYIIHCQRNPIDTCLSIYFQDFTLSQTYATDLRSIGLYYNQYLRLMDHWQNVLKNKIIQVKYENLVNDLETESRRIVNFINLEWNDSCLAFYKQKRDVNTPSYEQVRQPIYKNSMQRWKKYEPYVSDLINTLKVN